MAVRNGDMIKTEYLYDSMSKMGAILPAELMDRAQLTISMYDAMRSNDGHHIMQCLEQCDSKMLGMNDQMPMYRTATYFVEIAKLLTARSLNLEALRKLHREVMEKCPDVPNRGQLFDRMRFVESMRCFAYLLDT